MPTPKELAEKNLALERQKFSLAERQFAYQKEHDREVLKADKVKSWVPITISVAVLAVSIVQVADTSSKYEADIVTAKHTTDLTKNKNDNDALIQRDATDLQIAKMFIEDAPNFIQTADTRKVALEVSKVIPIKYGAILQNLIRTKGAPSEGIAEIMAVESIPVSKARVFIHYQSTPEATVNALVSKLKSNGYSVYPSKDNNDETPSRLLYFTSNDTVAKAIKTLVKNNSGIDLQLVSSPIKNPPDIVGIWLQ